MKTTFKTQTKHSMSPAKANHLFWLGRYAERVYTTLHLLRKHYDLMIDEDETAYISFCRKMGIENKYTSSEDFMQKILFDVRDNESVINMLEKVKDNAILLREEIYTETLSYVELSIAFLKNPENQQRGISGLQALTDYILAFWGSIDERITNNSTRHTIKFGKFLESMELHMRFEYPFDRIEAIFNRMLHSLEKESQLCDEITLLTIKQKLTRESYPDANVLYLLNSLSNA